MGYLQVSPDILHIMYCFCINGHSYKFLMSEMPYFCPTTHDPLETENPFFYSFLMREYSIVFYLELEYIIDDDQLCKTCHIVSNLTSLKFFQC